MTLQGRRAPCRLEATRSRHREVHDHDVGPEPLGEIHRLVAGPRLADHADAGRRIALQKGPDPGSQDGVIVGQQHVSCSTPAPMSSSGL